jgi:hypothetical protein
MERKWDRRRGEREKGKRRRVGKSQITNYKYQQIQGINSQIPKSFAIWISHLGFVPSWIPYHI